jgi:UDPglucose--hexose-1-phosphate uridylyltransferase
VESTAQAGGEAHDAGCYLCPRNQRANGEVNPDYPGTFVFENDFAALLPEQLAGVPENDELLQAQVETGVCRVVCFSPDHRLTLARMSEMAVRQVVDAWAAQSEELFARPGIQSVVVFENRGEMMGCSNPHPHGQIWATSSMPEELRKEDEQQRQWWAERKSVLLLDYLQREKDGPRVVCGNEHFTALVPWWAAWPFETLVLPHRHVPSMMELREAERHSLADVLRRLSIRYDNLFATSFPYSMGVHQMPGREHWQMHLHFYPPLLRSATVKKFMVGFEMLGNAQRDITAELAAERLRAQSEVHYLGSV